MTLLPDGATFIATIVADTATNKLDALAILSAASDGTIVGRDTPDVHLVLQSGSWAVIDIPKFGEPPPLTIDISSRGNEHHASAEAAAVSASLSRATGWSVRVIGVAPSPARPDLAS